MRTSGVRRPFLATLAALPVCLGFAAGAQGDLDASEAALNPSGSAYEINLDDQGLLWISDYDAGQVWGLYPDEGFFEVYSVMGAPSDARHEDGWLWWADGEDNILGRVSTLDGAVTRWEVPGAAGFYGTAVDAQGRLWVVDAYSALLYRLDAEQSELCTFTLPAGGMSNYLVRDAGSLWLGDWVNGRLLRLTVSDNHLTWWSLPEGSSPFGMAVDGQGNLWFADQGRNVLAELDPIAGQLASYALPQGTLPTMLAVEGDLIWYTEQFLASPVGLDLGPHRSSQKQDRIRGPYPTGLGRLDPLAASHTDFTPTVESTVLAPSCASISPASSGYATITVEDLAWGPASYSTVLEENGWSLYQLPEDALPWGIAATGQGMRVVDSDRQVLANITSGTHLLACVVDDADGDPATTGDQAPLPGRTLTLYQDGAPVDQQVSGANGCYAWRDLSGGQAYQVLLDVPPGWIALTPALHDFGLLPAGTTRSHTFANYEANIATACKYEDQAGDGLTPDDPLYTQGWEVSLTADGQVVDTQTTGPDGCTFWDGLGPLEEGAYGVREAEVTDWEATEPMDVQFAPPISGDTFEANLANFQQASLSACVLADGDGDLGTPSDQIRQAGWTVFLRVDAENQLPGQATGTDGCTTWTGLGPGHAYGASQALPEGWVALTGTAQDFDLARSGDLYTVTFVNATQESYQIFLPLVTRH